jgi:hypothetical protein
MSFTQVSFPYQGRWELQTNFRRHFLVHVTADGIFVSCLTSYSVRIHAHSRNKNNTCLIISLTYLFNFVFCIQSYLVSGVLGVCRFSFIKRKLHYFEDEISSLSHVKEWGGTCTAGSNMNSCSQSLDTANGKDLSVARICLGASYLLPPEKWNRYVSEMLCFVFNKMRMRCTKSRYQIK